MSRNLQLTWMLPIVMHLLIDGDIIIFRFACAFEEKPTDWGDGIVTGNDGKTNFPLARKEAINFIKCLEVATWATKTTCCFTEKGNFRYDVLPTYKANRKDLVKPKLFYKLKRFVENNYECKTKDKLEADDTLGILSTLDPGNCVIATIDKDLKQIPGHHYNWNWGRAFEVDEYYADLYFYQQILTGDPIDGYKGIPGVGEVGAIKILKAAEDAGEDYWLAIVRAYEAKGMTEEDALQQARVARMCRAEDYNFEKGEVILWEP